MNEFLSNLDDPQTEAPPTKTLTEIAISRATGEIRGTPSREEAAVVRNPRGTGAIATLAPETTGTIAPQAPAIAFDEKKGSLEESLYVGTLMKPDEAAKTLRLSKELNLPPDVVLRNLSRIEADATRVPLNPRGIKRESPVLSEWLAADSFNVGVSQYDVERMSYLERQLRHIRSQYQSGLITRDLSAIGEAAFWGHATPKDRERQAELQKKMEALNTNGYGIGRDGNAIIDFIEGIPGAVANQVPIFANTLYGKAKGAIVGAAGGAATGAAVGGAAGALGAGVGAAPGAAAGAIAGGKVGGILGWRAGAAIAAGQMEGYLSFLEYEDIRDNNGAPLDPTVARGAAAITGMINGSLEVLAFEKIAKTIPGLRSFGRDRIKQALKSPTAGAALREYAKAVGSAMSTEGATEFMQSMVQHIIGEVTTLAQDRSAKDLTSTELLDRLVMSNLPNAIAEGRAGAQGGGGMAIAGGSASAYLDFRKAKQARETAQLFKDIGESVGKSEILKNAPEKLQEFAELAADSPETKSVFTPIEKWTEYWQSNDIDPGDMAAEILGDREAYDLALETGGYLEIPTATYALKIAPTQHNEYFANEIKFDPDALSVSESEAVLEQLDLDVDHIVDDNTQRLLDDRSAELVAENIQQQLIETGKFSDATAASYSKLYESAFRSLGERSGIDPLELFNRYKLRITDGSPDVQTQNFTRRPDYDPEEDIGSRKVVLPRPRTFSGTLKNLSKATDEELANEFRILTDANAQENIGMTVIQNGPKVWRGLKGGAMKAMGRVTQRKKTLAKVEAELEKRGIDPAIAYQLSMNTEESQDPTSFSVPALEGQIFEQTRTTEEQSIDVDGIERPTVNSDGRQIAATDEDIKNFWRWFGDSQVTDLEGRPKVMYHATGADFDTFDKTFAGSNTAYPGSEKGFFFAASRAEAGYYLDVASERHAEAMDLLGPDEVATDFTPKTLAVYLRSLKPLRVEDDTLSDSEAFDQAQDQGRDAVWWPYGSISNAGETIAVLSPNQIKSATDNSGEFSRKDWSILNQRSYRPKGRILFNASRQFTIEMLDDADLSTFLHETGHFYLEVLSDLAKVEGADSQIKEDVKTLLKWMDVETWDDVKVEQHEQFARGFEAYLMEGKSPSSEMVGVFARFRTWLKSLYSSLSKLNVTLTPEVRSVFDRMLATDAEIAAAEKEANVSPMFLTAEEACMNEAEFKNYKKTVAAAHAQAIGKVELKAMQAHKKEFSRWWKEEKRQVKSKVLEELATEREYVAHSVLTKNLLPDGDAYSEGEPLKLSRAIIADMYGAEVLESIPAVMLSSEGGVHPDIAADIFGFTSGDALLTSMSNLEPLAAAAERISQERMVSEHGGLLGTDGSIADVALEAVTGEAREEVIKAEMKALQKLERSVRPFVRTAQREAQGEIQTERAERAYERRWFEAEKKLAIAIERGESRERVNKMRQELSQFKAELKAEQAAGIEAYRMGIPTANLLQEKAKATVSNQRILDIRPHLHLAAAKSSANKAVQAAMRKNYTQALSHKRRELLSLALYRESNAVLSEASKIARSVGRLSTTNSRKRIGKAGHDYLEQLDSILELFQFKERTRGQIAKQETLREWVAAKESEGVPVVIPERLLSAKDAVNFKSLSIEELREVKEGIDNIVHLARTKNKLLASKYARDIQEAEDLAVKTIVEFGGEAKPIDPETRLPGSARKRSVDAWFAAHRKFASLVRQMDGYIDGGPLWNLLVRPLNEAGDLEAAMNERATIELTALFKNYSGPNSKDMYVKKAVPNTSIELTKMGRLMVALNSGNAINKARIMDGYGYTASDLQAILNTLTEQDWDFVQGVWEFLESYWADLEQLGKDLTGLRPAKVEATDVITPFGVKHGGYFPISYDDRQSQLAVKNEAAKVAERVMRGAIVQSTTEKGMMKARVQGPVDAKVRLDFGVLFEHTAEVVHTISHTRKLQDVSRILSRKAVREAIYNHYGDIVYKQLTATLMDVAAGDIGAAGAFEKAIGRIRQGTVIAGLGWNTLTSALQPLGLFNSASRIGAKWVIKGVGKWISSTDHMEGTVSWIHEKSDFMRLRHKTLQREINEISNSLKVDSKHLATSHPISESFFYFIGKAQMIADIPTWLGQYEKSMAEGMPEDMAIGVADQAVIDSQGGGQNKDLSAVQRGGPLLKIFTAFYSYFNVVYNQLAESADRNNIGDFKNLPKDPAAVGRFMVDVMLTISLPAAMSTLLTRAFKGGGDDDLLEDILRDQVGSVAATMLLSRELAGAVAGFYNYEGPAGLRGLASGVKLVKEVTQADFDAGLLKALNATAGVFFQYPSGQVERTAKGILAIVEGDSVNPLSVLFGPRR